MQHQLAITVTLSCPICSPTVLPLATRSSVRFWWTEDEMRLLYSVSEQNGDTTFSVYDLRSSTARLLANVAGTAFYGTWAADTGWLAFMAVDDDRTDVYAINIFADHPLLHFTHSIEGQLDFYAIPPRWLPSGDEVAYALTQGTDMILYVARVPDGETREVARLENVLPLYDHEWSPDGWWLAVSFYASQDDPSPLYVFGLRDGTMMEVPTDLPPNGLTCVGWFVPEVYASGETNLCDVYMGIGS